MGPPGFRQVASRRCDIAIISSPSRGQAVGPKSRESGRIVGVRTGVCVEARDDLSPARSHAPGAANLNPMVFGVFGEGRATFRRYLVYAVLPRLS